MATLTGTDAAHVLRLRDLLERYRPSERPIADEFIHELTPVVSAEGSIAFRAVRGELGWSADFVYCTSEEGARIAREHIAHAQDGWTPFLPVTPEPLRNRAIRPKAMLDPTRFTSPTAAYRETLEAGERMGAGLDKDDLVVSVCDSDVVLAWFGSTRSAPFGLREMAVLDAIVPALRARMLLEHQLERTHVSVELLQAALDAIPTAAFVLGGSSIEHANATGRILLERDRERTIDRLSESLRAGAHPASFTITPVESPGVRRLALAVLRADGTGELERRLALARVRHKLTPRQRDVLVLLARGYGNKTIAERIGVVEATVEEHVTSLLRKLGAESRAQLVARFWTE
jgi:DNA-binding CsgD family transcriptional regulator